MIRSSYNYYSHFTDGKVKSEDSNPPHFSAAELGLNLLGQLTLSLCSWQLSGRVLGGAGLCDCGCVGVKGDVQPSDSPGPSPTLCSPAQPSPARPPHITQICLVPGLPYYRPGSYGHVTTTFVSSWKTAPKRRPAADTEEKNDVFWSEKCRFGEG